MLYKYVNAMVHAWLAIVIVVSVDLFANVSH